MKAVKKKFKNIGQRREMVSPLPKRTKIRYAAVIIVYRIAIKNSALFAVPFY